MNDGEREEAAAAMDANSTSVALNEDEGEEEKEDEAAAAAAAATTTTADHLPENSTNEGADQGDDPNSLENAGRPNQSKTHAVSKRTKKKATSTEERKKQLLEKGRDDARREHEALKRETMGSLPEEYLNSFGQIAFVKWSKVPQPVLIQGPFSVPPGQVRGKWFEMFNNLKRQNRMASLTYLVYWYGAIDLNNCYSFIPQKQITWYEDGVRKGIHVLPAKIQKKIDEDRKLTNSEEELRRGYAEMEEDLPLAPDQRVRGGVVVEGYQLLTVSDLDGIDVEGADEDDDDDDDAGNNRDDNNNDDIAKEDDTAKRKAKNKRGRKPGRPRKQVKQPEEEAEIDNQKDDDKRGAEDLREYDGPTSKSPAKRGRPPKRKNQEQTPEGRPTKRARKGRKRDESATDSATEPQEPEALVGEEAPKEPVTVDENMDEIGDKDEDEEQGNDDNDEDYIAAEAGPGDDDAVDEQYEAASAPKLTRGGRRLARRKKEDAPAEETGISGVEEEEKTKKGRKPGRKPVKEKSPHELERESYKRCQKKYVSLIENWETAVESKNVSGLGELMEAVLEQVSDFSFFFMKNYIHRLMMETKAIFQQSNSDLSNYQMLRKRLKEDSEAKMKELPPGFELPLPAATNQKQRRSKRNSTEEAELPLDSATGPKKRRSKPSTTDEGNEVADQKLLDAAGRQEDEVNITFNDRNPDVPTESPSIPGVHAPKVVEPKTPTALSRPVPAPKLERKKFTLGSLMRPSSKEIEAEAKRDSSDAVKDTAPALPKWMTASDVDSPTDENRAHAMEFFRQMTSHFPPGRLNIESIALAIEQAVFKWARSSTSQEAESETGSSDTWLSPYWMKVHFIVAAVSGKHDPGTLMHMIVNGEIQKPDDLVVLNDDKLWDSYEGRAVSIP